jgi:EAL domain-containing protein (putative c-di-GMP-specific phosphodiesterase class I)
LGMTVIAEGIETDAQKAILVHERCDEIQGGLVSMPLPPGDFVNWLNDWEAKRMDPSAENETSESITQWH